jgi:hypothetical protein
VGYTMKKQSVSRIEFSVDSMVCSVVAKAGVEDSNITYPRKRSPRNISRTKLLVKRVKRKPSAQPRTNMKNSREPQESKLKKKQN